MNISSGFRCSWLSFKISFSSASFPLFLMPSTFLVRGRWCFLWGTGKPWTPFSHLLKTQAHGMPSLMSITVVVTEAMSSEHGLWCQAAWADIQPLLLRSWHFGKLMNLSCLNFLIWHVKVIIVSVPQCQWVKHLKCTEQSVPDIQWLLNKGYFFKSHFYHCWMRHKGIQRTKPSSLLSARSEYF